MGYKVWLKNIVGVAWLVLLLAGCDSPKRTVRAEEVCPKFVEINPLHVVFFLCDRSGSVQKNVGDRMMAVRTDAANVVPSLPPATGVFGRWISENSYPDSQNFLQDAIPGEPAPVQCDNPVDQKCQKKRRLNGLLSACPALARKRIADKLLALNPDLANRTDIGGAVAATAEGLEAYPGIVRRAVIWTDGKDNVGRRIPNRLPGLEGAHMVLRVTRSASPEQTAALISDLRARLTKWGATVEVLPPEVPLTVERIFPQNGAINK